MIDPITGDIMGYTSGTSGSTYAGDIAAGTPYTTPSGAAAGVAIQDVFSDAGFTRDILTIGLPDQTPVPYTTEGVGLGAGAGLIGGIGAAATAIPAVAGAAGITLPAALATILGVAGAGYGVLQALGLGEGGGIGGINLLGGDDFSLAGVEFGGPGLSEPKVPYKEWHQQLGDGSNRIQYYYVTQAAMGKTGKGGRIFAYNTKTKQWKTWRLKPPYVAHIGKNMPSHKQITRLRRNLSKQSADARTILRITSPTSLKGYYKTRKRR